MTAVTGAGPWPGTDPLEAQATVVGDLAEVPDGVVGLPFSVLLPARGPWADATGRAAALLADLPVELGPHGWRLADRPGHDAARAAALLRQDVDALAVAAHGWDGPWVVPVLGPLSLAASLYLARGDRAVGDEGALRELAESQAAGLGEHLAALRRALPGARPQVLLHEPLLAAVVAGVLPSFSGYARLRAVPAPVAAERVRTVADGLRAAGAEAVVVHGGAARLAVRVATTAGVDGVGVTVAGLDEAAWEGVAEVVEGGTALWAQLPPRASSQCAGPDVAGQAATLLDPWRRTGLEVARLRDVVLLDGGASTGGGAAGGTAGGAAGGAGTGGRSSADARAALAGLARAALVVAERAEG
ncbi:hypothetical protein [Cellulomonas marina]|uniref:Methionine synthase n=1 Tax=Cellulomonas marina TaxID=988821 RepID=A0A1I0YKS8_9CELL|nr:hypothetical protein [Cellulomonas marina]GIG30693.1 hypothetical protein Cma02nite_32930 [Cellulomonas marina]SFB14015.1 hypothetical protein SAMN05421867_10813 [Cellulomonas marina]